jgi:hypothetical protein
MNDEAVLALRRKSSTINNRKKQKKQPGGSGQEIVKCRAAKETNSDE